jgi:hypothetical protein
VPDSKTTNQSTERESTQAMIIKISSGNNLLAPILSRMPIRNTVTMVATANKENHIA